MFSLPKLKELVALRNPVGLMDDYRFRVLQNIKIEKLDYAEIRQHLRDRLEELAKQKKLDVLVEQTTNDVGILKTWERIIFYASDVVHLPDTTRTRST